MENIQLCQSCGIPLDKEELKGTKENGLKSEEYCKYCYEQGAFTKPNMTLDQMKGNVESVMKKMELPKHLIDDSLNILPQLNRWKSN